MSVTISPVNTGITANDGTGDSIQSAFNKVNASFTSVSSAIIQLQSNAIVAASVSNLAVTGNLTVTSNVITNTVIANLATYNSNVNVGGFLTVANAIQFANLTTNQIANIGINKPGMTVFNYSTGNIQVYNGTKWANITLS